ncbi:uncharacterized protein LOC120128672 [Hibiscus syriacus]|uniref:uncharacterized protein LOC120128672 n=1 Tax=Hibiscus syriacus TaxID=106335 RepID=UPI001921B737|nr:uncharacterized protein LOC120128672 [Hibiscus syriacus]
MGENIGHLHQNHAEKEVEEEEEAFSLRDFPLDSYAKNNPGLTRRSSSESAPEFFEFLSDLTYDMCPADDIIFCGKLIPLNQQQQIPFEENKIKNNVLRKRSESFSELRSESATRSDSTKEHTKCLRNSRSLDYKKLRRYDMERNPSKRSARKSDISAMKVNKRRWYVLMLGMVKFPPEMELKDIKSRQFRRNQSVMFPKVEDYGKKVSGDRTSGKGQGTPSTNQTPNYKQCTSSMLISKFEHVTSIFG